jgi:transposase
MTYDELMLFVVKQQKLTRNVVTNYEASASEFHLHRRFEQLGLKNYVVQPQDWDERGKGVKNDRLDAAALCRLLDRYQRGNKKAFGTVRIPTVDEERERAMTRQRQQLLRERQSVAGIRRELRGLQNIRVTGTSGEFVANLYRRR